MKKSSKILALATTFALSAVLGGCNASEPQNTSPTTKEPTLDSPTVQIGIIQFAPHPSLDECTTGILDGLQQEGYVNNTEGVTIDIKIADGTTSQTDLMAKTMVSSGYDIIIPVATPAAMSAYSVAKDVNIPVIYSAVASPLDAGLAKELDNPQTGASGTSDMFNLEGQLAMMRAFCPDATTVGVLYTTSEPNSLAHLDELETLAPNYGFSVVAVGITNESEVASGATSLVAKGVDVVTNFTDNNVVNNLSALLNATNQAGIPVFGSEITQVMGGCIASETLDYLALGNQTGVMAAQVLGGTDILTLPVAQITDSTPVYSQSVLDFFGITLPDSYAGALNVDQ